MIDLMPEQSSWWVTRPMPGCKSTFLTECRACGVGVSVKQAAAPYCSSCGADGTACQAPGCAHLVMGHGGEFGQGQRSRRPVRFRKYHSDACSMRCYRARKRAGESTPQEEISAQADTTRREAGVVRGVASLRSASRTAVRGLRSLRSAYPLLFNCSAPTECSAAVPVMMPELAELAEGRVSKLVQERARAALAAFERVGGADE